MILAGSEEISLDMRADGFSAAREQLLSVIDHRPLGRGEAHSPAEKLASRIREQVLQMEDGAFVGSQEDLLGRYVVNVPTLRQAMAALAKEQLITSRRGVGGGFFVRRPDADVVTHSVALYLRSRGVALSEQITTLLPVRIEIARRAARSRDASAREELVAFLQAEREAPVATDHTTYTTAERQFNRLLARLSGSSILALFLEILFDLSGMIHREADVFGGRTERRLLYRTTRNLIAEAVLARDETAAMKHAEACSRLTWTWLSEARPDLVGPCPEGELTQNRTFARVIASDPAAPPTHLGAEETDMPSDAATAIDALRNLEEQQRRLDQRRTDLEQAAAGELGRAVIKGGGLILDADQVRTLIEQVVALGAAEAMRRLKRK